MKGKAKIQTTDQAPDAQNSTPEAVPMNNNLTTSISQQDINDSAAMSPFT